MILSNPITPDLTTALYIFIIYHWILNQIC